MKTYARQDMTEDEFEQAQSYCRLQNRCDELASQLYEAETRIQNLQWDVNFYRKLWEGGLVTISQNV